ncbi:Uncharacterised protein [uncultured archaeon]|nr:Uncharacterised protein [uncultured archaeon]
MKALTILLSVLLVLSAVAAQTLPLNVEHAQIDNTEILASSVNKLDIERDQDFTLKLEIFASNAAKDVEIRAFISGYEFNDANAISKMLGPFDFAQSTTYIKKMTLTLPDDVDVAQYYLRVVISDRNGEELIYRYTLNVNAPRHMMKVQDIILSTSTVQAGQALLASIRLENQGQKDESDVKVVLSIPSLGITATNYIAEVQNDKQEETEEMFLRLPKCAEPGVYDLNVEALYNDGHDKATSSAKVTVLENEACKPEPAPVVVVQEAQNKTAEVVPADSTGKVRSALEIILLVLVALLVIVGLIIGFTRMRGEE